MFEQNLADAGATGVAVQDEGVGQGQATTLNFVGAEIAAAVAAGVATITHTPTPPPPDISCRVTDTTNTFTTTTPHLVTYGTETWDTDAIHDNAVNPSRLTAKTAGKYIVTLNLIVSTSATWNGNVLEFAIRKNGATQYGAARAIGVGPSQTQVFSVSAIVDLAVNDFVDSTIVHNNTNAAANTVNEAAFSMAKLPG